MMRTYNSTSLVEEHALHLSKRQFRYQPTEKISIIEVQDFPSLGKITALRFLEWLQHNPDGVIALPTGKTPEYFIKWTAFFLNQWPSSNVQHELATWGLDQLKKPDMRSYRFVQIDEFYPMNPSHENSFAHYINHFYFRDFGLDPAKALLMNTWTTNAQAGKNVGEIFPTGHVDVSLRFRRPTTELERRQFDALIAADQSAMEYETKIRACGGIGFFLGGIGPDGHIGFNIRGSDHLSTTRLIPINYETAASAATDLGGMELARQRLVITIGLSSITQNKTATAIIIAAGESKAHIVKDAVENEPSVLYPATALQALPGARFYLTQGAACKLTERRYHRLNEYKNIPQELSDEVLIDIAVAKNKPLLKLTNRDLEDDYVGSLLIAKNVSFDVSAQCKNICDAFTQRISQGRESIHKKTFLHTAPHHDDIMLGYLPYIEHLLNRDNAHYFATMTSGFTSVSNNYMLTLITKLQNILPTLNMEKKDGIYTDIYHYLDATAARDLCRQQEVHASRLLNDLGTLFATNDINVIAHELEQLKNYFLNSYPGKKDTPLVQTLKGMIREWEEELLWAHFGFGQEHVFHLRLGFYTGDIFTQQPEFERDAKPIINLLEKLDPDIITVAMDPEASGPDTHYKVLQAVAQALQYHVSRSRKKDLQIIGYRNVWYRFHPAHTNIFVPVSLNSCATLRNAFTTCFGSQREASFPSHEYDGPFSDLAQKIMTEQYMALKKCLGDDYFAHHTHTSVRAAHGFCFLKQMTPEEFFATSEALKKHMELRTV
jgi:glucosamine-6-phosphate deaminase